MGRTHKNFKANVMVKRGRNNFATYDILKEGCDIEISSINNKKKTSNTIHTGWFKI